VIPLPQPDALPDWTLREFGYAFREGSLCRAALTHRSAGAEHNERLEFLGDSVLNCAVARLLFDAHGQADEGSLSRLRSALVSGETLAAIAADIDLGEYLNLGAGELRSGGFRRASILADALEALFGAIFLDGGFDAAAAAVRRVFGERLAQLPEADSLKDPKTRLQEILQAQGIARPVYTLPAVSGDLHAQSFTAACEVAALGLSAVAQATSRRRAEQLAASKLLELLPTLPSKRP
jgi:ribonuclease-3